jgi:hypothetical protein
VTVKYHRPRYAMAQKLRRGPGVAVPEAVRRAEANVEAMREELLAELGAGIDALETLLRPPGQGPGLIQAAYDQTQLLIAVAGACGLDGAASAAHGLCELLDRMSRGRFEAEPIAVHVRALRLLGQPGAVSEEEGAQILQGLEKVCSRYGD